jgi:hypothetical protein
MDWWLLTTDVVSEWHLIFHLSFTIFHLPFTRGPEVIESVSTRMRLFFEMTNEKW